MAKNFSTRAGSPSILFTSHETKTGKSLDSTHTFSEEEAEWMSLCYYIHISLSDVVPHSRAPDSVCINPPVHWGALYIDSMSLSTWWVLCGIIQQPLEIFNPPGEFLETQSVYGVFKKILGTAMTAPQRKLLGDQRRTQRLSSLGGDS